jgi:hypothetical protein
MEKHEITDVFHQSAGDGIPAHWCVQWYEGGWASYEYFATKDEAVEFALQHDCDEGLL